MNDADRMGLPRIPGLQQFSEEHDLTWGVHHWDRSGNAISFEDWARLREFGGLDYIRVAYDETSGYRVSTVWLGIDHGFGGPIPIIFETMVFADDSNEDLEMDRYATEEQALAGHAQILARVQLLADATELVDDR